MRINMKLDLNLPQLDREQLVSVAALALLLFICLCTLGFVFQARHDAADELAQRRELLSRLETRVRSEPERRIAAAPAAAFLDAPTQGLASAQLQAYLAKLAETERASLMSSGGEATKREDAPDTIRLQATLELSAAALRALLYRIESGTPYVFVEALSVQPVSTAAGRAAENPLLRASLSLRALWRKGAP